MPRPIAIISACDETYFPLLSGLVQSLHDQGWHERAELYVLDVGLTAAQREEVGPKVTGIADGTWPDGFTPTEKTPRWYQAMLSRPHLPDYFPGHEIYLWLDADTWLAESRAVELLIDGAQNEGLALVPEVHPAYRGQYAGPEWPPRKNVRWCYRRVWGDKIADAMATAPILNSGVFAMRQGHPIWEKWMTRLRPAFARPMHPLTEQCALNLTIYGNGIAFAILPAWCNWIWHEAQPRYNPQAKRFDEPIRPYAPISILHGGDFKFSSMEFSPTQQCKLDYLSLKEAGLINPRDLRYSL